MRMPQIAMPRKLTGNFRKLACSCIMMSLAVLMLVPASPALAARATGETEAAGVTAIAVDSQDSSLQDSELTFLFFYADWCSHCQLQKPVIGELESEYSQSITFISIDGPGNPELVEEYGVEAYPTMILISGDGGTGTEEVATLTGFTGKDELESLLDGPYASVPDEKETCAPLPSVPEANKPSDGGENGIVFHGNSLAAQGGPLIDILTPGNNLTLNAPFLRVHALVEASASSVPITKVQFSLDGKAIETMRPRDCGQQLVTDIRIDLRSVADGLHQITVTAFQDRPRMGLRTSVSVNFTLDRTLPETPANRVEEIATPAPFTCLSVTVDEAQHLIQGDIVPGTLSDGLDPAGEHFVIVIGAEVVSLPVGSFVCKGRRCEYSGAAESAIQKVTLTKQGKAGWAYSLALGDMPPADTNMYLRFGNDWGAINLDTGRLVTGFESELDSDRSAHARIGPTGGIVETTDAAGVVISLEIPPDALAVPTDIVVTPLLTSAIPGYSGALHQGVRLEPEGISFFRPAILSLNFSGSGQTVESQHFIFLLTSPLTALPLVSQPDGDTLSASVNHFSTYEAGGGSSSFTELAAWGDPILESMDLPTLTEIQSLLGLAALQQAEGCTEGCLDLAYLSDWAVTCIETLMGEACQQGLLDPSDEWLEKLVELWAMYESFDTGDLSALTCIEEILQALIEEEGAAALASPTDANLQDLADRKALTAQLGLDDLEALADAKIEAALFEMVQNAAELCQTDEGAGRQELDRAAGWAELIGSPSDLATAIQNAVDDCGGQPVDVVIKAHYTLSGASYAGSEATAWSYPGPSEDGQELLADAAPPITLSAYADRASAWGYAASPGDGIVFALNASADASLVGSDRAGASVRFDAWMDLPGPGTLEVELNPEWGIASGTTEAHWWASIGQITSSERWYLGGVDYNFSDGYLGGLGSASIPIASAGTYSVDCMAYVACHWQTGEEWGSASGGGWVVTVRWVPGPQ